MGEKLEATGWWIWAVAMLVILVVVVGGLNAAGIIGKTWVERKVFEQSYQRSEGLKERIATFEAQLAEINARLAANPNQSTTQSLMAQKAAITVQLNSARRQAQ